MKYKEGDKVQMTGTITGIGETAGEDGQHLNIIVDGGTHVGLHSKNVKAIKTTSGAESHVAEVPAAAPGEEQTQNSDPKTKTKTAVTKKKK